MTFQERTNALAELIVEYEQNSIIFQSIEKRTRWLNQAVPLLNFSATLYQNALAAADILSHPGFPDSTYEQMEARLLLLVRQGLNEMENGLTPPEPKIGKKEPHTLWEWWKLASGPERFGMVGFFAVIFAAGFLCGEIPAVRAAAGFTRRFIPLMRGH
ncbi:MAG: hypothetical protein KGJ37_04575 [Verrucomicrobiota bacterium]|nr:hypothetical protein [Verrucomicrobiota bacterium]